MTRWETAAVLLVAAGLTGAIVGVEWLSLPAVIIAFVVIVVGLVVGFVGGRRYQRRQR